MCTASGGHFVSTSLWYTMYMRPLLWRLLLSRPLSMGNEGRLLQWVAVSSTANWYLSPSQSHAVHTHTPIWLRRAALLHVWISATMAKWNVLTLGSTLKIRKRVLFIVQQKNPISPESSPDVVHVFTVAIYWQPWWRPGQEIRKLCYMTINWWILPHKAIRS
jgi:hypothetical protein